jgi:hypothetical protein
MNACSVCQLPVVELDGQFENLQAYDAETGHPAAALAGECHSRCLVASAHGHAWSGWRLGSYARRGYRRQAEQDGWTVLVHQRQPALVAVHETGCSVAAERRAARAAETVVESGILVAVDEPFSLSLDNALLMADLKSRLRGEGRYPILDLLHALGVIDRMHWPQALANAAFVFDPALLEDWRSTAVAMQARYAKLVPAAAVAVWNRLAKD